MNTNVPAPPEDARSFAQFLQMLEDGQLNADLSEALRNLNAAMNNHVQTFGGKCKGYITVKIDFALEKGVFDITADFQEKLPKAKRDRSIAWSTPGNNFTPENPRQMSLFAKPRDVTSEDAAKVRTV